MTNFAVESWIWYGVTLTMVVARFVARILHFKSIKRLMVEDWLMLFLTCLYTILIAFLNVDHNVSTNLIDPNEPIDLTPHEIDRRTWGSKTVLLVEQCMCAVQWGTKGCLLLLYWRLTQNLTQNLVVKCVAVYVVVTYVVMEVLYFAVWCRPFHDYWKTPTDNTQCTTALHHLITNLVFNLSSDVVILSIPLPLLLRHARLEYMKKLLLIFPFSLGFFTMVCAILSKVSSFEDPYGVEWVFWYCREASTAMIVANMPYSWQLIRRVFDLKSFFGSSTQDEMQGGRVVELHGHSLGDLNSTDFVRPGHPSQAQSHSGQDPRKRSWPWRKGSSKHAGTESGKREPHIGVPHDSNETDVSKDIQVDETGTSSASRSSIHKQKSPAPDNETDVDRLYRLDDDEDDYEALQTRHITQRGYDG